ncbi:glycosyl transferase [Rudanella paleaurantiibacter]|uniref:Glycosyl transferase n=1 Tax=Rudanella paleaurantiibacter TaxID=2614655 RepID=A0A7J5U6D8_9BACT|nr:glycosyltransferase family 9 protein [Rudanella paleaurantiibacter]KAB7733221.1 glycosyl transferase [Rudanella paleaurantiibacter]
MNRATHQPWADGWRILCARPDNLGDVLMTTPAFRALKTSFPGCHLTLLTSSAGRAVAGLIPDIDEVLTIDLPWVKSEQTPADPQALFDIAQTLRAGRFDAAVVFTVQSQNPLPMAILCYMAQIRRVLGHCRENPYHLITDWVPDPEVLVATRHEVTRQLDLVRTIGATTNNEQLTLRIPAEAPTQARHLLGQIGLDRSRPWVLLHAGVSEEKRRYPAGEFAEVGRQLTAQGIQVGLTGSADERAYVQSIGEQIGRGAFNLAGTLPLPAFCALVADAPVLLANNTGPVHIAAAVGTPVVVAYAKTNPQHTPWMVPNRVLYMEVPPHLRSSNVLLQQFPEPALPKATPNRLVQAIAELLTDRQRDWGPKSARLPEIAGLQPTTF